jgi:outer membrane protein assembly factor BamB
VQRFRQIGRVSGWVLAVAVVGVAAWSTRPASGAEEWPKWRGPRGDSIVRAEGLLDRWPEAGPRKLWSQPAGVGFSSPIGFEGRVYLFSLEGDKETLAALDAETGKPAWSQGYEIGNSPDYAGTRATPTIEGNRIYTYGSTGMLVARNLPDGKEIWRLDVLKASGASPRGWGQASSPTILDNLIYIQSGDGGPVAVAVDKNSGKIAWQSQAKNLGGFGAAVVAEVQGKRQLVVFGGKKLYGMDPQTGRTIWNEPWETRYDVNASTPIVQGDQVFITSGYGPASGGCALFQLSPNDVKPVWEKKGYKGINSKFQTPILDNGYLYGVTEEKEGSLKCLEWATGKEAWHAPEPKRIGFGASLVRAGDKLIVLSQTGTLYLMLATPQKSQVISKFELFPEGFEQVWSTPLVYREKLYAKGEKELVCLEVGKR